MQAGIEEYKMPDLSHHVTARLHALEPDTVQGRSGQDINGPLLLINPQAAKLTMEMHKKGFMSP